MKKEFKRIKKVSKKLVSRVHHKKLKKIKDFGERTEGLKYLIDSNLKTRLLELESKLDRVDKKEALILESKIKRLSAKIKIFNSTYSKNDLKVLQNLINEIEEELKNV